MHDTGPLKLNSSLDYCRRRRRRNRTGAVIICAATACMAGAAVSIARQLRQADLDSSLIQAVKTLDAPAVDRLLALGANPDSTSEDKPRTVPALIARLVDNFRRGSVRDENELPPSPLGLLMLNDMPPREYTLAVDAIASALIRHGANLRHQTNMEVTPLSWASEWSLHRTIDASLARNVDVDERVQNDSTALMGADAYATRLLIERGANVNAKDDSGFTPLFEASNSDVARLLIDRGADVNAIDHHGRTVLECLDADATTHDRADIIRLLRQHGARPGGPKRKIPQEEIHP